ncbi:hypothetical protein [Burkholderia sp. LA-2-3-30-S1-D2]|uniref:hypothetical protein n=1 Tax=Burkholderia sp. LA-2-3-30-S1-D2 TaxID=1637862 RepID=UPI000AF0F402|nr:hypothetical protein [Burkholderia sp. LA-2-3-30-S1-D2]
MKHIDGIRFVATGLALRHVGRVRAPRTHARVAPVARVATALCGVARRSLSLRLVMQLAAAPRPSRFAASRMPEQRPPCRRSRGADRFLLFALP